MGQVLRWLPVVYALVASAACVARTDTLRTRAVYDLQCPDPQLIVRPLGGDATGVWGCGRYATYVDRCDSYGKCTWIMNSVQIPPQAYGPPPAYNNPPAGYPYPAPPSPSGPAPTAP